MSGGLYDELWGGPGRPRLRQETYDMAGATDRIGIGMIGAGSIAGARHVPGLKAIPGVELVGVVNRSPESSRQAAQDLGFAKTYASWPEVIDDPAVDAIVVATWPYLHAPVTLAALDAGKHVLTQARMAMNSDEAQAMLSASLEHPELVAMVVPAPTSIWGDRTIARVLADGSIGDLRTVRLTWGGSVSGGAPDPWRRQKRYSGNNVMAVGILAECIARWLGNAAAVQARTENFEASTVTGGRIERYDVPDYVAIQAEYPGHVHATMEISSFASAGGANSAYLFGTKGTLKVDFDAQNLALSTGGGPYTPVEIHSDERLEWNVEAEFIGAIRGQNEVRLTDFATAVCYMEFTDAVAESAKTGQRIAL